MKILLTGGSGFIGRNIIEAFDSRYTIIAPSSKELDLTDESAVRSFFYANQVDIVIHSAVRPGHRNAQDPSNQLYINTRMYFNIIRNADRFKRLIFIGSGAAYDVKHAMVKVREEDFDKYIPSDEHGFSKYIINKHLEQLDDAVDLRVFGIFGKYEDYAIRFISNAICKTLFNLPITIRQNRMFDYLFIDDLMPVLEHFIHNKPSSSAYNVTPAHAIKLSTIAELVKIRSGREVPVIISEQGLGLEYSGNNQRLHTTLPDGLKLTPINVAIDQLYTWYEQRKDSINYNALLIDK